MKYVHLNDDEGDEYSPYEKIEEAKLFFDDFHREGKFLNDMYRAEGNRLDVNGLHQDNTARSRYYSVLWANVQILLPSIYQKAPNAYVQRRFHDKDDVARTASEMLERVIDIAISETNFNDALKDAVKNRLICGMGCVWIRHAPQFFYDEEGNEKDIVDKIELDNVDWRDFLCSPTDRWSNVTWVARRVFLTKKGFRKQFNKDPDDYGTGEDSQREENSYTRRRMIHENMVGVWEFWDKENECVYFISDSCGEIIEKKDDYLKLEGFFPCPRPFFATTTPNMIIPVPDYKEYVSQAETINTLTRRIQVLVSAVRAVGLYDASIESLERLLTEATETQLIPVENISDLKQKGGQAGSIEWFPVQEIASVIPVLYAARQQEQDSLDLITGLSDIIRGSGEASETATAQNIKAQYASIRLKSMQDDCFSFVRDIVSIMGEIIVKHFSAKSLLGMSNYEYEEDYSEQNFKEAYKFMKDYQNVKYRIDIETDSIMVANEAKEQESRISFLQVITGIIEKMMMIPPQAQPTLVPLMGEFLMFVTRSFKVGRELEQSIEQKLDETVKLLQQSAQQQDGQPQDPNNPQQGQGMTQTVINQDAPKPLQPQDLLKANIETEKQMYETLRTKIKIDKEVFIETGGVNGKIWTDEEINEAMNAINRTNKESDIEDLSSINAVAQGSVASNNS